MPEAEASKGSGRPVLLALLLIVGTVAIVAVVLYPTPSDAPEISREARCMANLKSIGMACYIYAAEHDDYMPFSHDGGLASLSLLDPKGLDSGRTMLCPEHARTVGAAAGSGAEATATGRLALTPDTCSYAYLPGRLGVPLKTDDAPADLVVAYDREWFHKRRKISNSDGGRNVLYADGHVEFLDEEEFQTRLAASKQRYEDYRSGKRTPVKAAPK